MLKFITVTNNTFFGFPFVVDAAVAPGRLEMLLEEDEGNETGKIEIHGRSFIGAPGTTVEIFCHGVLVHTIEFVKGQLLNGPAVEPNMNIGPELQRFVDSLRSTH